MILLVTILHSLPSIVFFPRLECGLLINTVKSIFAKVFSLIDCSFGSSSWSAVNEQPVSRADFSAKETLLGESIVIALLANESRIAEIVFLCMTKVKADRLPFHSLIEERTWARMTSVDYLVGHAWHEMLVEEHGNFLVFTPEQLRLSVRSSRVERMLKAFLN